MAPNRCPIHRLSCLALLLSYISSDVLERGREQKDKGSIVLLPTFPRGYLTLVRPFTVYAVFIEEGGKKKKKMFPLLLRYAL
jgi:hypothetical protein